MAQLVSVFHKEPGSDEVRFADLAGILIVPVDGETYLGANGAVSTIRESANGWFTLEVTEGHEGETVYAANFGLQFKLTPTPEPEPPPSEDE